MKRHPAAIASDEYFEDGHKGEASCDPLSLQAPKSARQYLTNRLHAAFQAGYKAGANQSAQEAEEAEKTEFFRLVEKFGHLL